jgi:hypothetical protein
MDYLITLLLISGWLNVGALVCARATTHEPNFGRVHRIADYATLVLFWVIWPVVIIINIDAK